MSLTATTGLFVLGLVLLVAGAEGLVRGASRLAMAFGLSPLVIGLTVVAIGTSCPELAVSLFAVLRGGADIAVGNVVGSNIANVLLILGVAAVVAPVTAARQLVRVQVPLMIAISILMLVLAADGSFSRWNGLLLSGGLVVYTVRSIRRGRDGTPAPDSVEAAAADNAARPWSWARHAGLVVVGLLLLVLGARAVVRSASSVAASLGVDDLVIGLTVVAFGTSLPELATTVVATLRGERDLAVGNAIGSNVYNILGVLGLTALLAPGGVSVAPSALRFDIPVMIVVAVACFPVFFTDQRVDRWEGVVFLGYYAAYTVYLILDATEHAALQAFSAVLFLFALPLTALTLGILTLRAWRRGRTK